MKILFRDQPHRALPVACLVWAALALGTAGSASAADESSSAAAAPPPLSLQTANADEGFALAVKLSQKAVGTVQPDVEVRTKLRQVYANDPDSLIAVSQVVATHFQTIAAANDYWRE